MRIVEETCGEVRILRLSGEFDTADVPAFAARLDAARSNGAARVFVNLRDVTFASAAALGYLLEARSTARPRAGDVVLIAPSRTVRRLASAVGLERMFPLRTEDKDPVRHAPESNQLPCVA